MPSDVAAPAATSHAYVRWEPDRAERGTPWPLPTLPVALLRGLRGRCPACGQTRLFQGYLKVTPVCPHCTAPLGLARADDAPPYFTLLIAGHILVPAIFLVEHTWHPAIWLQTTMWLPITLALTLALLQPVKGATVGLMLRLGMLKSDQDE